MQTEQCSRGRGHELLGTGDLGALQEPLGPSQTPGLFLETSESQAIPRCASCLPRLRRSAALLPSPPPCLAPQIECFLADSPLEGKAAGHAPHPDILPGCQ